MVQESNTKIYCSYHDPKLLEVIRSDDNCIPYYTNGNHINSLDNLNQFVNEFTAMWYVWQNGLYSPYIGFTDYRRQELNNTAKESNYILDSPKFYWRELSNSIDWLFTERFANFLKNDFIKYIKSNYKEDDVPYIIYIKEFYQEKLWIANECYILQWNQFVEMMNCIGGFINYINRKYNLYFDYNNYKQFIIDNWINVKDWENNKDLWMAYNIRFDNKYRIFSYVIEILLGYYLKYYEENN